MLKYISKSISILYCIGYDLICGIYYINDKYLIII